MPHPDSECAFGARDLGIVMKNTIKPSAQCKHATNKARQELFHSRTTQSYTGFVIEMT